MSALAELARIGLKARITEGRLQVGPPDRVTPEARVLVERLADRLRAELTEPPACAEPAPRFRAWTMHEADGRRIGTMVDPRGITEAEALASLPRPGLTVTPQLASRVD